MAERPQLTPALSDRYAIQRRLGAGGMAVPGAMRSLGRHALPLFAVGASGDLERATAVARNDDADVWM